MLSKLKRQTKTKRGGGGLQRDTYPYCPNTGVPLVSDLDVYILSRISQQHQAWDIKGTDIEAVLMTKDCTDS